jgi:hypothetical protein
MELMRTYENAIKLEADTKERLKVPKLCLEGVFVIVRESEGQQFASDGRGWTAIKAERPDYRRGIEQSDAKQRKTEILNRERSMPRYEEGEVKEK